MRRTVLLLLLVVSELVAVAVVVRIPDVGAAAGFLRGGYPTGMTVLAASALVIWIALVISAVVLVVRLVQRMPARVSSVRLLLGVSVAASLGVLCLGVVRHLETTYSMCCGSVDQARQLLSTGP